MCVYAATKICNYKQLSKCPLDGRCLSNCITYKSTASSQKNIFHVSA